MTNEKLLLTLVKNKLAEAEMRQGCTDYTPYAQALIDEARPIIEDELIKGNPETVWGRLQDIISRKVEEARKQERERIIGIINDLNSIGYSYGADYNAVILQALKEEK